MTDTRPTVRLARFAAFELDLVTGELRRGGTRVRLQEQPFRVLALLVQRAGDLVTRDELHAQLWPEAVYVDFDHGLNKAVAKIRLALGDRAESPTFVETLERRGYRFIAAVEAIRTRATTPQLAPRLAVRRLQWGDRAIVLAEGTVVVGRDPAADVWVDSSVVSRHHATILVGPAEVRIENKSKNGTFVNDRPIVETTILHDGDAIRIGPALMAFRSSPAAARTLTAVPRSSNAVDRDA
jgi:DNA-binding winged helix-turn-helix (wHTH) protein